MNLGVGVSGSPNHSGIRSARPLPASRDLADLGRRQRFDGRVAGRAPGRPASGFAEAWIRTSLPGRSLPIPERRGKRRVGAAEVAADGRCSAGDGVHVPLRGVVQNPAITGHQRHPELARRRDQQTIGRVAVQLARQARRRSRRPSGSSGTGRIARSGQQSVEPALRRGQQNERMARPASWQDPTSHAETGETRSPSPAPRPESLADYAAASHRPRRCRSRLPHRCRAEPWPIRRTVPRRTRPRECPRGPGRSDRAPAG